MLLCVCRYVASLQLLTLQLLLASLLMLLVPDATVKYICSTSLILLASRRMLFGCDFPGMSTWHPFVTNNPAVSFVSADVVRLWWSICSSFTYWVELGINTFSLTIVVVWQCDSLKCLNKYSKYWWLVPLYCFFLYFFSHTILKMIFCIAHTVVHTIFCLGSCLVGVGLMWTWSLFMHGAELMSWC